MIGCLGGLGRSMSKWMIKQGARKFVFLGRSGIDKTPARKLVEDLEHSGATVLVVRGDVGRYSDVQRCVEAIDGDIGGVIQAAMGLNVSSSCLSLRQSSDLTSSDRKRFGLACLTNSGTLVSTLSLSEAGTSTTPSKAKIKILTSSL